MSETGLRARKRARTRDQIADAATTLFIEKGYDATTLEEIAEVADVHKRTLLRYFPTKAHLVLHNQYAALETFREALAARGERSAVDVWQDHVIENARATARRGKISNARAFARNEPAVEPAYMAIQAQYQSLIAEALMGEPRRLDADGIGAHVIAAALVGGNYAVGAMIHEAEAYGEMETSLMQVIKRVRAGLMGEAVA